MTDLDVHPAKRGPAPQTRLPIDALFDYLDVRRTWHLHATDGDITPVEHGEGTMTGALGRPGVFERITGINRGQYHRFIREGGVTVSMADHIADAIGRHPTAVWGMEYWTVVLNTIDEED